MAESHLCPQCGVESHGDATEGLCPNCLMQMALESTSTGLPLGSDASAQRFEAESRGKVGTKIRYFGDYELLEEIARGGMGIVYRARQLSLNRIVAVKMMRPGEFASEVEVQRFLTEAEAAANLQHPNIVAIHEVGEHEGLHYFSMDYVEGESLAGLIARRPLPANKAASYLKIIAEAIDFAHRQGTLHRDLKPANILIDGADQPRITDFGLAKSIESDSELTATNAVIGTPNYMPPEQAEKRRGELGPASDVYSLGAILYEMLTGRPPFQAETPMDTVMMVLNSEPVSPRLLNPGLNRDLETICLKCLEKEPARRYNSAQELADDLKRFLNHRTIRARPVRFPVRAWRWLRRNPWPSAATIAVVLVLVALVAAFTLRERMWQSLSERARSERLAGRRSEAMNLIAEAARIKSSDDLRAEAILAITTPGVRLLQEIPFGNLIDEMRFSPDAKMLAITGRYNPEEVGPEPRLHGLWDKTVKVWEIPSGRPLAQTYCAGGVGAIAFSKDSSTLAVWRETHNTVTSREPDGGIRTTSIGKKDQGVLLWDPVTGREIAQIKRPSSLILNNHLTFSPEGDRLMKSHDNCTVWTANVADLSSASVFCIGGKLIAYLADGELLIEVEGRLQYYSLRTLQRNFASPEGMESISVSADGRIAVLRPNRPGQKNDSLVAWDVREGRQVGLLPVADANQAEVLINSDGRFVALYEPSDSGVIQLWEMTTAGSQRRLIMAGSNAKIIFDRGTAFSPDGYLLAAFVREGGSGALRIWSTQTGRDVAILPPGSGETRLKWTSKADKEVTIPPSSENYSIFHSEYFIRPAWSSDGRLLATISSRKITVRNEKGSGSLSPYYVANVWEVVPPTPDYRSPQGINSIIFSSDGKQVFSNGSAWEVVNSHDRMRLQQSSQPVPERAILFGNRDQVWAAELPSKYPVKLMQLVPQQREAILEDPGYSDLPSRLPDGNLTVSPGAVALSPDGKYLVMACSVSGTYSIGEMTIESWNIAAGKRLALWNRNDLDQVAIEIIFSPDGRRIVTRGNSNIKGMAIWDTVTGAELYQLNHLQVPRAMAISPDSKLIFTGGLDTFNKGGVVTVNEVQTGREAGVWKGHKGTVSSVAVSPDGRLLATGSEDLTIRLWQIPVGRELARWEAHKTTVSALTFSPDGRTLVSGGNDGTLKLWNIPFIRTELSALGLDW